MRDFGADEKAKPEENLRSMFWAPLLKNIFSSLKLDLRIEELLMIAEYDTSNIPGFHERRYVDIAVVPPGPDGLPILLVEMSAHPVPEGLIQKDFRKMAICMVFILMEKVKRAEVHCPDEEFTKFRVYGLFIAGYDFEFCVGTVNFMFHSNSENWKLKHDDLDLLCPTMENEFECAGNSSVYGPFSEFWETLRIICFKPTPTDELGEDETVLPSPNYLRTLIKYHFYLNYFIFN